MTVLAAALEATAFVLDLEALVDVGADRPLPGARDLLAALDGAPWTVIRRSATAEDALADVLRRAGLPHSPLARGDLPLEREVALVVTSQGVAAARSTGARVVAVATAHPPAELAAADLVVAGLDDLRVESLPDGLRLRVVIAPVAAALADTVRELAAMTQTGLEFVADPYDRDRYHRIRAIAARLGAGAIGWDEQAYRGLLDADLGYATPKVDVRGLVRDERGRVLLVREISDGRWSLPGGWADTIDLPSEAIAREVREEAGWRVEVTRLLACWDRIFQSTSQPLPHRVYKLFFACRPVATTAGDDRETDAVEWFAPDALPPLSLARVTPEQIARLVALDDDPQAAAAFH